MLTSESNHEEFRRFFMQHEVSIFKRLLNTLNKKHRHSLVKIKQKGGEFPTIFSTYKVGDITFYTTPVGLQLTANGFKIKDVKSFIIMRDLRTQTRIMVVNTTPYATIYSAHAISRYKQRLGLDEKLDFVEVCKDMAFAGCDAPFSFSDPNRIYGSNLNSQLEYNICTKGVFLGYISTDTKVSHAETFLSPKELSENQQFLDVSKNPIFQRWLQMHELHNKGMIKGDVMHDVLQEDLPDNTVISIEQGQIKILSEEEKEELAEKCKTWIQNPLYWAAQILLNKQRVINKMNRKGYM